MKSARESREAPHQTASYFPFAFVLAVVFFAWLRIFLKWKRLGFSSFYFPLPFTEWPGLAAVKENLVSTWRGFPTGYAESLTGYLLFFIFALCFIAAGRMFLDRIFGPQEVLSELSGLERFSLSYLLGSLILSLVWLGLGSLGLLKTWIAVLVAGSGAALFLFRNFSGRLKEQAGTISLKQRLQERPARFTATEKILLLLLAGILLFWSARSVRPEDFRDSLLYYVALAKFYIAQGNVTTYPYHLHTYLPQNSEMLYVWSFVSKSEMAASLLNWGFLTALICLAGGFLNRLNGALPSLAASFLIISAPICAGYSLTLKNDMPAAAFIFAHYCALIQALNLKAEENPRSARWAFLAGVLWGGAAGHKLNALFVGAPSAAALIGFDLIQKKKGSAVKSLALVFLWGMMIPSMPWFARTTIAAGSPIYPHLNKLFSLPAVKPWHMESAAPGINPAWVQDSHKERILEFVRSLAGMNLYNRGVRMRWPEWGPTLFFALLVPFSFRKSIPIGFRIAFLSAVPGEIFLALYSVTENYHLPFLIFLVSVPFALHFGEALKSSHTKVIRVATFGVLGLCLHKMLFQSSFWLEVQTCVGRILSGYPSGNYPTSDPMMDNVRWLCRILDKNSEDSSGVLFVGNNYIDRAGRRKIGFNSNVDRELISDFASQSAGPKDLRILLEKAGFGHFIVFPDGLAELGKLPGLLKVSESDLGKIKIFLKEETDLRFSSLRGDVLWHSLKGRINAAPVHLTQKDIQQFPIKALEHAASLNEMRRWDESEQIANLAIQSPITVENKVTAFWTLGFARYQSGDSQGGEEAMQKSIHLASKGGALSNALGNIYRSRGEYSKALEWHQKAVQLNPRYGEGYYNLADAYFHLGNREKALEGYEKSLECDPERVPALNDLGGIYFDRGDYSKAAAYYQKALEIDPQYFKSYGNLSSLAFAQGRLDLSREYAIKALRINPSYALAHYNLGDIYTQEKDFERARQSYEKAIVFDPKFVEAYNNMGALYESLGRPEKAAQAYIEAIQADPRSPAAHYNLGNLHYKEKRYGKALEEFEMAARLKPEEKAFSLRAASARKRKLATVSR